MNDCPACNGRAADLTRHRLLWRCIKTAIEERVEMIYETPELRHAALAPAQRDLAQLRACPQWQSAR